MSFFPLDFVSEDFFRCGPETAGLWVSSREMGFLTRQIRSKLSVSLSDVKRKHFWGQASD